MSARASRRRLLAAAGAFSAAAGAGILPAAEPARGEEHRLGTAHTVASAVLGEERTLRADIAPESLAAAAAGAPLTVIWVLDGERLFLPLAAAARYLAGGRFAAKRAAAVIGVDALSPAARTRDLTPSASAADRSGRVPEGAAPQGGGADNFLRFLAEEALPLEKALLPRGARAARRALFGHSFAGLFTLFAFAGGRAPFDDFAAIDASLWWDRGRFAEGFAEKIRALPEGRLKRQSLFLGFAGAPRRGRAFAAAKTALAERWQGEAARRGAACTLRRYPAESHGTVALPGFYDALKILFGAS
jgi:predicted alpha/beta superfamily hydrolase